MESDKDLIPTGRIINVDNTLMDFRQLKKIGSMYDHCWVLKNDKAFEKVALLRSNKSGITMEVKGRFPEECAIDAYDLCTIFSNILSNALEAAVETEEKTI